MTIVDKTEPSDPSTCQNQPGSSEAVSPEDMDTGSASWGAVSSISDVSNHTLSLGPVPGAVVYNNSSVPEKSKPSPPKDQGMTAVPARNACPGDSEGCWFSRLTLTSFALLSSQSSYPPTHCRPLVMCITNRVDRFLFVRTELFFNSQFLEEQTFILVSNSLCSRSWPDCFVFLILLSLPPEHWGYLGPSLHLKEAFC